MINCPGACRSWCWPPAAFHPAVEIRMTSTPAPGLPVVPLFNRAVDRRGPPGVRETSKSPQRTPPRAPDASLCGLVRHWLAVPPRTLHSGIRYVIDLCQGPSPTSVLQAVFNRYVVIAFGILFQHEYSNRRIPQVFINGVPPLHQLIQLGSMRRHKSDASG